MLKFTLVIFFITTFHILPVYSQNKGDSIRLTIRNLIPIAHDYVTMNYNDRYYDLKYKVLTDQKTTFSFPADEKYKVLLFRYNNLSFSYLVFTGDSLEITYDKNNNLRARSLSNHPFIKISEEIHDKAGDMFDLSFEVISYKRLNSYLSSIYEKYTKRRNILDSISASLSLDTNQQRVFQSELYGKYLIDKFLPFYQQRPLNIDSLPSYYKKEMGEDRSYFNEKEINRSTNENRMAAHDYFKFYDCPQLVPSII